MVPYISINRSSRHKYKLSIHSLPKTEFLSIDGSPTSNLKLVEKVVTIAGEVEREIAIPDEARSMLSLNPDNRDRILTRLK
jgi:hypothetical protein